MSDPLDIVIDLDSTSALVTAWNEFCVRVPLEPRRRLAKVFMNLLNEHPGERVRELMHGKTVGEVLQQFESAAPLQPIESGERDALKWALYDPPADHSG